MGKIIIGAVVGQGFQDERILLIGRNCYTEEHYRVHGTIKKER